jgi:hypothetical protein
MTSSATTLLAAPFGSSDPAIRVEASRHLSRISTSLGGARRGLRYENQPTTPTPSSNRPIIPEDLPQLLVLNVLVANLRALFKYLASYDERCPIMGLYSLEKSIIQICGIV